MAHLFRALTRLALILCLAACGQSGPLYLPGNPSEIESPIPAEVASENDEEQNDGEGG